MIIMFYASIKCDCGIFCQVFVYLADVSHMASTALKENYKSEG